MKRGWTEPNLRTVGRVMYGRNEENAPKSDCIDTILDRTVHSWQTEHCFGNGEWELIKKNRCNVFIVNVGLYRYKPLRFRAGLDLESWKELSESVSVIHSCFGGYYMLLPGHIN